MEHGLEGYSSEISLEELGSKKGRVKGGKGQGDKVRVSTRLRVRDGDGIPGAGGQITGTVKKERKDGRRRSSNKELRSVVGYGQILELRSGARAAQPGSGASVWTALVQ